jgi:hypothetical protein
MRPQHRRSRESPRRATGQSILIVGTALLAITGLWIGNASASIPPPPGLPPINDTPTTTKPRPGATTTTAPRRTSVMLHVHNGAQAQPKVSINGVWYNGAGDVRIGNPSPNVNISESPYAYWAGNICMTFEKWLHSTNEKPTGVLISTSQTFSFNLNAGPAVSDVYLDTRYKMSIFYGVECYYGMSQAQAQAYYKTHTRAQAAAEVKRFK